MQSHAQIPRPAASLSSDPVQRLSRLERQVVLLSLDDPQSSLRQPSKWEARWRKLFGIQTANPLADPRLEALRRFAVLMRIDGYSMPQQEYRKLTEAGFDELIADEIYLLTSPRRPIATPAPVADQCLSIAV